MLQRKQKREKKENVKEKLIGKIIKNIRDKAKLLIIINCV